LREPDAFPAADIGLMRALTPPGGARPAASEVLVRAEAWRPWRAYAAQHLWTRDAEAVRASARTNSKDNLDAQPDAASNVLYRPGRKPGRDDAPLSDEIFRQVMERALLGELRRKPLLPPLKNSPPRLPDDERQ
jgi:hypothetical protein